MGIEMAENGNENKVLDWEWEWEGMGIEMAENGNGNEVCLLYTSPSPRDGLLSRMPSSA